MRSKSNECEEKSQNISNLLDLKTATEKLKQEKYSYDDFMKVIKTCKLQNKPNIKYDKKTNELQLGSDIIINPKSKRKK